MAAYSPTGTVKHKIREMDEKIVIYSKYMETVPYNERRLHLQSKLLGAKLMKEKLVAMTALAKAQSILAEMDVLIAENNLKAAVDQLDKLKMDNEPAEKNPLPVQSEPTKLKQKELEKSATEVVKHDLPQRVLSPADTEKENTNTADKNKPSQLHIESHKTNTSRSQTPTDKNNKRRHSSSSSKCQSNEKKLKRSHTDAAKTAESHKTLIGTTLSPIGSKSTAVTIGVQTCSEWFDQIKQTSEGNEAKRLANVTNRIIGDDENTVVLETLSAEPTHTHKDAINLSKALQQIMSPKPGNFKAQDCITDDLSKIPVPSKIQLLFEDEPKKPKKKSRKVKVKSEAADTGDDVLIL